MGILAAVKTRAARRNSKLATAESTEGDAPTAPHVERAYRYLKAAIVDGRYRPGASLSEVGLASEHGMSRTPMPASIAGFTSLLVTQI